MAYPASHRDEARKLYPRAVQHWVSAHLTKDSRYERGTIGDQVTTYHRIRIGINAVVKALARAFRWRKLIETDAYATMEEMAAVEKINASYVCRVLQLTLRAPNIVEAIVGGPQASRHDVGGGDEAVLVEVGRAA